MDINTLLGLAKGLSASDIHMIAQSPPILRIHGILQPLEDWEPMKPEDLESAFLQLTSEQERREFRENSELDFSYTLENCGRFRCNAARHMGTITLVIRLLPLIIPSIESLGLPIVCRDLIQRPRGLIIISGPTGSGKSTTAAAMLSYLNTAEGIRGRRIVTVEDPIEYVYPKGNCVITQREIGADTQSFSHALKHVLRQDPDVIVVGEMRDPETAAAALTIAETGHLVVTTGHAPNAQGAVERFVDLFPIDERHLVQARIASLIEGILCQALIPRLDKPGRAVAVEVMLANNAIRNVIREGKIFQLPNIMRTNLKEGMQMLDMALLRLYREAIINRENLMAFCNDQVEIEKLAGQDAVSYADTMIAS